MIAAALLTAAAVVLGAFPASAQTRFLSRYDFHLNAERVASGDEGFTWDADFGGDLDLVDYGAGRFTFLANYETVLGGEIRRFDPNQGNYTLAGSVSARLPRVELAAVFHHVSRHLSDRAKFDPIDWNMVGARALASHARGALRLDSRADLRGVVQRSHVDYEWELDAELSARYGLRPHVAVVSRGGLRVLGVDGSGNRDTQSGYRAEGGLRLEGSAAAVELFAAVERRIDPFPFERGTATWATLGFRLLGR